MLPAQTAADGPLSVAGAAGILLSDSVLEAPLPQPFTAATEILPLLKLAGFTAIVIELVVEVPVNPAGSTQL